jgi:hypothetical protein
MPEEQNIEAPKDHAEVASEPKKKRSLMVIISSIGAFGVALIALNTVTGLNFRPAWGYETEQLAASDVLIMQRLEKVLQIQDATSRTVLELNKGQYQLRLNQIDRQKRELRRELAEHQERAQKFRDESQPVPSWLRNTIVDTDTSLDELSIERSTVETKILELE